MGEDIDPLTANEQTPGISHRRILFVMAGVIVAGSLTGFAFFSAEAGTGVLIGGILSFANYFWQKHSLKAIFDRVTRGKRSRFLAARFILRYVVIGAVLGAVYFSQAVSIFAVVFGLASFATAVVIEGLISMFSSSNR